MNPAIFFLLLSSNARNGAYSPIGSIDEPDDLYDLDDVPSISGTEWLVWALAVAAAIFAVVALYEVIVVGDHTWPA